MENIKDRKFCMVLYPEDKSHAEAVEKLVASGVPCAIALHDKDKDIDGNLKKAHWHVVVRFNNPRWRSAVAKEFGITDNYVEPCANLDGALTYLVHFNFPDKYQYDTDIVIGSLKTRLEFLLRDEDESTRVLSIYEMIANSPGIVTYTEIFRKACANGLYGDLRRMGAGLGYLIADHNALVAEQDAYEARQANNREKWDRIAHEAKASDRGRYMRVRTRTPFDD